MTNSIKHAPKAGATLTGAEWESASTHTGSGLPSQWTDGGHGNVTATVDDATKTPITVNTLVGQTVPGIAVIGVAGAAAAPGLYVQSGDSPGGSIATFLDNSESYGLALEATGEIQQSAAAVGNVWTARSYPGDRIAPPLHDILQLTAFGSLTLWADTDIDVLNLNLVDNGFTGGDFLVCGADSFRILPSGAPVIGALTAPADGDLAAGQVAHWFDQTNGASAPLWKAKSADGSVVSGGRAAFVNPTTATPEQICNALIAAGLMAPT